MGSNPTPSVRVSSTEDLFSSSSDGEQALSRLMCSRSFALVSELPALTPSPTGAVFVVLGLDGFLAFGSVGVPPGRQIPLARAV